MLKKNIIKSILIIACVWCLLLIPSFAAFSKSKNDNVIYTNKNNVAKIINNGSLPIKIATRILICDNKELSVRKKHPYQHEDIIDSLVFRKDVTLPTNNFKINLFLGKMEFVFSEDFSIEQVSKIFIRNFKQRNLYNKDTNGSVEVLTFNTDDIYYLNGNISPEKEYKDRVFNDLTKDDISMYLSLKNKDNEFYIYKPQTGFLVTTPVLHIVRPDTLYGSSALYECNYLIKRFYPYKDKRDFVFVIDMSDIDGDSYFEKLFGYELLSSEGLRVFAAYVKSIEPLLSLGRVKIIHNSTGFKYDCYLKSYVDYFQQNSITVENIYVK